MSNAQEKFIARRSESISDGAVATVEELREGRELPAREVGCKICNKSIHQIFVEHLEDHLKYRGADLE